MGLPTMQDSLEETLGPLRPPSQPWFPDVTISDQLPPVSQLDSLSNFKLESEIQWPTYLNRPTPGIISTNKWIKLHLELQNQDGSPLKWAPNLRVAIGLVKDNLVDKFEDPFEPKSDAEVIRWQLLKANSRRQAEAALQVVQLARITLSFLLLRPRHAPGLLGIL